MAIDCCATLSTCSVYRVTGDNSYGSILSLLMPAECMLCCHKNAIKYFAKAVPTGWPESSCWCQHLEASIWSLLEQESQRQCEEGNVAEWVGTGRQGWVGRSGVGGGQNQQPKDAPYPIPLPRPDPPISLARVWVDLLRLLVHTLRRPPAAKFRCGMEHILCQCIGTGKFN